MAQGSKVVMKKCSPVGEFYSSVIEEVLADSREVFEEEEIAADCLQQLELLWRAKLMIANPDKVHKQKLARVNIEIPIATGSLTMISIPIVIPLSEMDNFQEVLSLPKVAETFTLPSEKIAKELQNQLNIHFGLNKKQQQSKQKYDDDDENSSASSVSASIKINTTTTSKGKKSTSTSTKSIKKSSVGQKKMQKNMAYIVSDDEEQNNLDLDEDESDEEDEEESDFDADDDKSSEEDEDQNKKKKKHIVIVPTSSDRVTRSRNKKVNYNLDGANDSDSDDFDKSDVSSQSEDLDDADDGDDDDSDALKINEEVIPDDPNEKPINSEDDPTTDEDTTNIDDNIENLVICQYQKITKKKTKFTMELKSGMMTLKGKDYVFGTLEGNAEWR